VAVGVRVLLIEGGVELEPLDDLGRCGDTYGVRVDHRPGPIGGSAGGDKPQQRAVNLAVRNPGCAVAAVDGLRVVARTGPDRGVAHRAGQARNHARSRRAVHACGALCEAARAPRTSGKGSGSSVGDRQRVHAHSIRATQA
jgi:hypothetical protein